eukprot:1188761-Prorocentrum_minimum.AAC.5
MDNASALNTAKDRIRRLCSGRINRQGRARSFARCRSPFAKPPAAGSSSNTGKGPSATAEQSRRVDRTDT